MGLRGSIRGNRGEKCDTYTVGFDVGDSANVVAELVRSANVTAYRTAIAATAEVY